ncbi:MAG TPA: hypothetical protein DCL44_02740 [Elusimicrobia bacterium]|nr:hypothetical protein [Elusimicrobiota bacterium]
MFPEELVKKLALENGASACGLAPAGPLAEYGRFLSALKDLPPSLGYLARNPEKRSDIGNWFAGARSALMCAFNYWEPGRNYEKTLACAGAPRIFLERSGRKITQPGFFETGNEKIARYALCPDYHDWVKDTLLKILVGIKRAFPQAEGRAFVDTAPVLEKEMGRLAGLGFRGKNTLLINPETGSYFVLGGLALNLELKPGAPLTCGCGDCDLCVNACPRGALKDGRLLSEKCSSYLTTQAKEKLPPETALNSGGFAYGCDICQEVCPFNKSG